MPRKLTKLFDKLSKSVLGDIVRGAVAVLVPKSITESDLRPTPTWQPDPRTGSSSVEGVTLKPTEGSTTEVKPISPFQKGHQHGEI